MTDWSKAGLLNQFPNFDTINVLEQGIVADGATPCDQALKTLLNDFKDNPTVFFFPPGEYYFTQGIQLLKGQVLKGASATETHLIFDLTEEDYLISANGKIKTDTAWLTAKARKDSTTIFIDDPDGVFKAGDFVKFVVDDGELVTSDWALNSTGQICKILSADNGKLTIHRPLRRSFPLAEEPRLVKIRPVQFVGVECLSIERKDTTLTQTSNIYFNMAANCRVSGIASQNCNFAHLTLQQSTQMEVSGCHFQDAFQYGGGGQGYGVVLQFNTGDCLVQNNIFQHLRHSMLLQAGANGNVLAYNYSTQPFWTETNLPASAAGDLVLHGNFVYENLLEGNIVQNIVIDDSHGINGPGNTFFRNRAELFGIFMNNNPASPGQLFIGNEVTSSLPFTGLYMLSGEDHFEYGNNVKGSMQPPSSSILQQLSLFLPTSPPFFEEMEMPFASIGLPNNLNSGTIPAKAHFLTGQMTSCEMPPPVVISDTEEAHSEERLVYPNPTNGLLFLNVEGKSELRLVDFTGKTVYQASVENGQALHLPQLPKGVYSLMALTGGQLQSTKVILQ